MKEQLLTIIKDQQQQLKTLEKLTVQFDAADLSTQNTQLTEQVSQLSEDNQTLSEQNAQLKGQLQTFMLSERFNVTQNRRKVMNFYYQDTQKRTIDRLSAIEYDYQQVLDQLAHQVDSELAGQEPALRERLNETQAFFDTTFADLRQRHKTQMEQVKTNMINQVGQLTHEPLPDDTAVKKRALSSSLELKLGGNISNLIGIMLLLFGVVVGLQNDLLPVPLRAALAYLVGAGFLYAGEFLTKKHLKPSAGEPGIKPTLTGNWFSIGLTALGVAILFSSTAFSHFVLGLLGMWATLGVTVLVSGVAFSLSLRYSSRVIASFALVGGYLPVFAVPWYVDQPVWIGLMVYTLGLSGWSLLLATQKKWPIVSAISFWMGLVATLRIMIDMDYILWLNVAQLLVFLGLYIGMILAYPLLKRQEQVALTKLDVSILIANTITNCLAMFWLLDSYFRGFDHAGLVAIGYFGVYFGLAKLSQLYLAHDKRMSGFFYLVALSFAILLVPMQFGADWLLIGWFVQAVLLLAYGVLTKQRGYERSGWVMMGLSVFPFVMELLNFGRFNWRFIFLHTFVAVGLQFVAWIYGYAHRDDRLFVHQRKGKLVVLFSYGALVHTWLYLWMTIGQLLGQVVSPVLAMMGSVVVSYLYGMGIKYVKPWLPLINPGIIDQFSVVILLLTTLASVNVNGMRVPLTPLPIIAAVMVSLISVAAVWDVTQTLQTLSRYQSERNWLTLAVSVYAWFVISQFVVVQFQQNINSVWVSGIGLVAALLWIVYGFRLRNSQMRLFGLWFSFASLAKMVVLDLQFLPQNLRILSYFVFGAIFMAISFVYQQFTKRLMADIKGDEQGTQQGGDS